MKIFDYDTGKDSSKLLKQNEIFNKHIDDAWWNIKAKQKNWL